MLLFLILMAGIQPMPAYGQCILAAENCTANDASAVLVILGSSPDVECIDANDTITLDFEAQIEPSASWRYDFATVISIDGDPVQGNDNCNATALLPIEDPPNTTFENDGDGPFRFNDADQCGDVSSADGVTIRHILGLTMPCSDTDNDGMLDLHYGFAWGQAANTIDPCTGAADILAGTSAKCVLDSLDTNVAIGPALPIEMATLDAIVSQQQVTLTWVTLSETENAGFEVEHAPPGEGFRYVDFVPGHGSTMDTHTYRYALDNLSPGRHVFRLKQVDIDGTFAYSQAVEVNVDLPGAYLLSDVYPNPFNPQAVVQFAVATEQTVELALYNAAGQLVQQLYSGVAAQAKTHTVRIDGSQLSSGVYFVRMAGLDFEDTRQVVLSR